MLEARDNPALVIGDEVRAMIRPERILLGEEAKFDCSVAGMINDAIFNGERLNALVQTALGLVSVAIANIGLDIGKTVAQSASGQQSGGAPNDLLLFPA